MTRPLPQSSFASAATSGSATPDAPAAALGIKAYQESREQVRSLQSYHADIG